MHASLSRRSGGDSLQHQSQLRCPAGPSRTPQCKSSRCAPPPLIATASRPSGIVEPPQHNAEHVADDEVNLDKHPEEPDTGEVSVPMASRLPTRECQSRSQSAAIVVACLKVTCCRRPQQWGPSARRAIKGERGAKQLLNISDCLIPISMNPLV